MIRPDFDDRHFGVIGNGKKRQRYADLIVQVPLRGKGGKSAVEGAANELLGGRLPV